MAASSHGRRKERCQWLLQLDRDRFAERAVGADFYDSIFSDRLTLFVGAADKVACQEPPVRGGVEAPSPWPEPSEIIASFGQRHAVDDTSVSQDGTFEGMALLFAREKLVTQSLVEGTLGPQDEDVPIGGYEKIIG